MINRIQLLLLGLLVFFLPFNLGLHLIQESSYVLGYLVPYFVPTLYLTDLILLALLILWGLELFLMPEARDRVCSCLRSWPVILWLILLILAWPNLNTVNPQASLCLWLLLLKGVFLFIFLCSRKNDRNLRSCLVLSFSFALLFQSALGLYQFYAQKPLFAYPVLGETQFVTAMKGVAQVDWLGKKMVRAYGTTPHPNVLGAFLVLGILTVSQTTTKNKNARIILILLSLCGLFFTFSRSAWLVLGLLGFFLWWQKGRWRGLWFLSLGLILIATVHFFPWVYQQGQSPAWQERLFLIKTSLRTWQQAPLFGVGLGNSLIDLQKQGGLQGDFRFLQPVHNIYCLLLSEAGLFGLSAFLVFLFLIWHDARKDRSPFWLLFPAVLLLGLFDHYWFTLQQGALLLFLSFGMVLNIKN